MTAGAIATKNRMARSITPRRYRATLPRYPDRGLAPTREPLNDGSISSPSLRTASSYGTAVARGFPGSTTMKTRGPEGA